MKGAGEKMGHVSYFVRAEEINGWRTRDSDNPELQGVTMHHDASSIGSGKKGALNIVIHGRNDLPGPLANVFIPRSEDGTPVYVVAAGRAHHTGQGGWRRLSGNRSVLLCVGLLIVNSLNIIILLIFAL
jgi:hypothetical protein